MRRLFFYPLIAALACVGIVLWAGCNESPLPGIEVANPDVEPESVRIVPKAGNEIYHVLLLDEASAAVDQLESVTGGQNLLDSVVVPYARLGPSITLQATFSNRRRIAVSATFGPEAGVVNGVLEVDGFLASACFEVPGLSPSCDSDAATEADTPAEASLAAETGGVMEGEMALAQQEPEETEEGEIPDTTTTMARDMPPSVMPTAPDTTWMMNNQGHPWDNALLLPAAKNSLVPTSRF